MGIDPPLAEGAHNVFFAVQPPEGVRALLCRFRENLCRVHGVKGRPITRDCLHVSLHFLGRFTTLTDDGIERAIGAAAALRMGSFDVSLNRVVSWAGTPGQRPLVLRGDEGVVGLDLLHGKLHDALAEASLSARADRAFEPHLTLLRGDGDFREMIVPEIRWTVRELVLIDSRVGEGRHDILARWSLTE